MKLYSNNDTPNQVLCQYNINIKVYIYPWYLKADGIWTSKDIFNIIHNFQTFKSTGVRDKEIGLIF